KRAARQKRYSDFLSYFALLKRSVSTVSALKSTLKVVLERYLTLQTEQEEGQDSKKQRQKSLRNTIRKMEKFGTTSQEEEDERQLLEVEDIAQQLWEIQRGLRAGKRQVSHISDVLESLTGLIELAEKAENEDPKISRLLDIIREIRAKEPYSNILIYTEYTTSQKVVAHALKNEFKGKVMTMSGEDDNKDRKKITDQFRRSDRIILVSTDAAAEGLNLHDRCHHLIHIELPYNPNRLEQRNGRIDRYGQKQIPYIRYLYLLGTFEDRILLRLIMKYERQRASLTFVPNTLGLAISTDNTAHKLIDSLTQDESSLFKGEDVFAQSPTADENEGVNPATLELLEEIDNSLHKFQKASMTNTWFGGSGMNADEKFMKEADEAYSEGLGLSVSDIVEFVKNAVLLDGGDLNNKESGIFELKLPPAWRFGLDDLPGYNGDQHRILLTSDMEITRDSEEQTVGYLGRTHPLVRKALDRVRNITFGSMAKHRLDPRASAVRYDGDKPAILFTFLGRMTSKVGREFEQIVAIKVDDTFQAEIYEDTAAWLKLTDPVNAIRTGDLWEKLFKDWGQKAHKTATEIAMKDIDAVMGKLASEHIPAISNEKHDLTAWLEIRCREITEAFVVSPLQRDLFGTAGVSGSSGSAIVPETWMKLKNPDEKLAGFYSDQSIPVAKRSEADGVLRLYKQRMDYLENRMALNEPDTIPLGILMLVPEE
ncbi:SWF/SNF helicase family protein, partial [bacterium]|nr:SWF/SNF helicase family protein [bacterium]